MRLFTRSCILDEIVFHCITFL